MSQITTRSGKMLDYLKPNSDSIVFSDIAGALGNLCRYSGQCDTFYSVAEHSVILSYIVEDNGGTDQQVYDALHHDDTEAYVADIPKPLKDLIPEYERIEDQLGVVIADKFNFRKMDDFVNFYDKNMCWHEAQVLFKSEQPWISNFEACISHDLFKAMCVCDQPSWATSRYVVRHEQLCKRLGVDPQTQ